MYISALKKTGTTTIQSILSKNNHKLLDEGICYLGRFEEIGRKIRIVDHNDPILAKELREKVERKMIFTAMIF